MNGKREANAPGTVPPEKGSAEIIAENRDWVVCLKPVGAESEKEMPAMLSAQLGGRFYPVHRLDQNVGGLMVYARNDRAAAELNRRIQDGSFRKEYIAQIHGQPPAEGRLEDLLWKDSRANKVFVVQKTRQGVKPAALSYVLLRTDPETNRSVVRVRLETGRSHQIRVQFASRGFPLVGDHKYGARDSEKAPRLFSSRISFPWKGEECSWERCPSWAGETGGEG